METKELLLDMQESHKTILLDILDRLVPAGLEVWAFGSRARWTARETSDLDLALRNPAQLETRLEVGILDDLKEAFEESDLPFMVDLLDWATVSDKFRKVIEREYVVVRKVRDGKMREGWNSHKIDELGRIVTGKTPLTQNPKNFGGKYPFITPKDMLGHKKIWKTERYLSEEGKSSIKNCLLPANSICVSCIGSDMGKVVMTTRDSITNQQLNSVICSDLFDPDFVYYAIVTISAELKNAGHHSTAVPILNKTDFSNFEIKAPDLPTQRRIAAILSALDEKIELNRQTNQSLEAIAQALFKEWFVDFNFPGATGEMQESELGPIPIGWRVSTLKDLTVKIGSGATPRGGSGVYLDEGIALIRSQNVYDSEFVWDGLARISDEAAEQLRNVEVQQEDVLLNITGASILRTCVVVPEVLPARVNQHVAIIRANPGIPSRYIHLHLLQQKTKDYLMALDAGGSREAVTKVHIESVSILNPPLDLLARFDAVTSPVYSEIEQLSSQTRTLASTRDILLPKLMNGEIAV